MREKKYSNNKDKALYKGIFSSLRARLEKNRLGELLVLDGFITPGQLNDALDICHTDHRKLGRVLVENRIVSKNIVRRTLAEQISLRCLGIAIAVFVSMVSMGFAKQARAGSIKDVPSLMQVANASFSPISAYPKLFGSAEKRSGSLKAFTKWTGMFDRFERTLNSPASAGEVASLKEDLKAYAGLPLNKMAIKVNDYMNRKAYVVDSRNYGSSDYWATPLEFMLRGGDCEDYAIAKYAALRALGVPEERLRLVILQDMQKNIPHAVLVVYTDHGPYILDNQIKTVMHADRIDHYKPIFSINRQAWWLHTSPRATVTVLATSSR